jgi:hypothetical protein
VGRVDVSIDAARHLTNKNEDRRTKSKKSNFRRRISQSHVNFAVTRQQSSRNIPLAPKLAHAEPAMGMSNYWRDYMSKFRDPKIFNALKHGVSSRQGLLPNENAKDYAALEEKWRRDLRPHGTVLEDRFAGIVRNRWQQKRNDQAAANFVACHPFGSAVAEAAGEGDWVETARKLLSDLNAQLAKIVQVAESLRKQAATTENAADKKRLSKAADKWADAAQHIADRHDMAMEFFLGLGDENRKQADRDAELDGRFNKLLTSYYQHEQMIATRDKQPPQKSRQSSANVHDEFIDELPEKSEPKAARPSPEKKTLAEPAKDSFYDDDDWGTAPKH